MTGVSPSGAYDSTGHPVLIGRRTEPERLIYIIGSLRNPRIPEVSKALRDANHQVFDEWYAAGDKADDAWRDYERERGLSYLEALRLSKAAQHVFDFDYQWLSRADAAVLVLPAGKSGHLELGWMLGCGKKGYILLDEPDRWDVMYKFATGVASSLPELLAVVGRTL